MPPRINRQTPALIIALLLGCLGGAVSIHAQIPSALTDTISKGSGTIDILKDVSGAELEEYINATGGLLLGVDLNENASGNENADSIGVAIKSMEFVLTTTEGTFTFSEFYTSTTAMIQEDGATGTEEFNTLFGTSGSSQINGGTSGFDLSVFDDVIELRDVTVFGDILDAQLLVTFLDTANTGMEGNETFFDYSGGFEDFALLNEEDAALLENAGIGLADAPESVSYVEAPVVTTAPGAPLPPLPALMALAALILWRSKRHGSP